MFSCCSLSLLCDTLTNWRVFLGRPGPGGGVTATCHGWWVRTGLYQAGQLPASGELFYKSSRWFGSFIRSAATVSFLFWIQLCGQFYIYTKTTQVCDLSASTAEMALAFSIGTYIF